jgi:hypothetical protein
MSLERRGTWGRRRNSPPDRIERIRIANALCFNDLTPGKIVDQFCESVEVEPLFFLF